jgi:hypothetical protein
METNIIGPSDSTHFSVFNNGNLGLPVVANCPIKNIGQAVRLFGDTYTILRHSSKYLMNWVVK